MFRLPLLVALPLVVIATLVSAATSIAPVQPFYADRLYDDIGPDAASDGETTLVVWENAFAPNESAHNVHAVFVGRDGQPQSPSVLLRNSAISPRIGTNGQQYLVAYGVASSRFNTVPYPNVAVRLIDASGTIGPEVLIATAASNVPRVNGVLWTGGQWIVTFAAGNDWIASLDGDLRPIHPVLDLGAPARVARFGDRIFVFQLRGRTVTASELLNGTLAGSQTAAFPQEGELHIAATDGGIAVVVAARAGGAELAMFAPGTGWPAPRAIAANRRVQSLAAFNGGAVLLHRDPTAGLSTTLGALVISSAGETLSDETLLSQGVIDDARLAGDGADPLLLVAAVRGDRRDTAIYAYRFSQATPLDADSRLVSVAPVHRQFAPLIGSAGSHAVAFWNQTVDDSGQAAAFSRVIDSTGTPTGEPVRLPFVIGPNADIAFDGSRFVLVWSGGAVSVSADGSSATGVTALISDALEPRVAGGRGGFFVVWQSATIFGQPLRTIFGTPLRSDGTPEVPNGFPMLPSIRSQLWPAVASLADRFVSVWREDQYVAAVVHSAAGTPLTVRALSAEAAGRPDIAGDAVGALAGWLSSNGTPVLTAFDDRGGSFDQFDPHWGNGFDGIAIAPSATPGRYLVGLGRANVLFVGEVGTTGSFITYHDRTPRPVAEIGSSFGIASAGGPPIAVFERDGQVFVGTPYGWRRRIAHR